MGRKKTFEEVKVLFEQRNYILLEDNYINNKTKMKYICEKHPDYIQGIRVDSLVHGTGCKYCGIEYVSSKKRLDFETVKETFSKRGYNLLESEYINSRTPMKFICPNHSEKENFISYSDLQQGHGCGYCGGTKKLEYNDIKSLFENNDYTLLETEYINNRTKMKCFCNSHSEYIQYITVNKITSGYKCIYCAGKRASKENNLADNFPEITKEWNYKKNSSFPEEFMPYSGRKIWWICEHSHEWKAKISDRTAKDSNCPICNESKGEKQIRQWLEENDIKYENQKEFDNLIGLGSGNLSYDFYIPSKNLLIEYQGEFHDGTARMQTNQQFKCQEEHDRRKMEYANKYNIELLEIWYWDFDNIENILENKFNNQCISN